jgi:hypothetical protein
VPKTKRKYKTPPKRREMKIRNKRKKHVTVGHKMTLTPKAERKLMMQFPGERLLPHGHMGCRVEKTGGKLLRLLYKDFQEIH